MEVLMKKVRNLFSILFVLSLLSSMGFANGLNLNSLGSRALAMGGAFVALADDFTAIYWNPAGAARFTQKQFGFYGVDIIPTGSYKLDVPVPNVGTINLVDSDLVVKHNLAGMFAYYHPVTEDLVAGIGVYTPAGISSEWDSVDFAAISGNNPNINWKSKIGVLSISPALAYRVTENISVGASLNINYGVFDLAMHAGSATVPLPVAPYSMDVDLGQQTIGMKGWGYGATFGVMFTPNEMFSLGAVLKTPYTVKFSGDTEISGFSALQLETSSDTSTEVTWPMWLAGGVAVKPMENFTVTADLQWTQWSKIGVIDMEFTDPYWVALMEVSGGNERALLFEDALQIRFGAEYVLNSLSLRGGFYIDPSPAPDKTMNVLIPNYDFNVFTAGIGYNLNGLRLDFGFEVLLGKERTIDYMKTITDPEWEDAMPGVHQVNIYLPNISISYRF